VVALAMGSAKKLKRYAVAIESQELGGCDTILTWDYITANRGKAPTQGEKTTQAARRLRSLADPTGFPGQVHRIERTYEAFYET
jgi:hypothetical protein